MAKYLINDTTLDAIADAIREKTHSEELMTPLQMPEEIAGISGGGDTDPKEYYKANRPAEWPKIPLPSEMKDETSLYYEANDCLYLLFNKPLYIKAFKSSVVFYSVSTESQVISGTVIKYLNGVYVSEEAASVESRNYYTVVNINLADENFDTYNYVVLRVRFAGSGWNLYFPSSEGNQYANLLNYRGRNAIEISLKASGIVSGVSATTSNTLYGLELLRYASVAGMARGFFNACPLLEAVPEFDCPGLLTAEKLFSSCTLLKAVPSLDIPNATSMTSTFENCVSLRKAPPISAGNALNINKLFQGCTALNDIQDISVPSAVSAQYAFSKTAVPFEKIIPVLSRNNITDMTCLCQYSLISGEMTGGLSGVIDAKSLFSYTKATAGRIVLGQNCTDATQLFRQTTELVEAEVTLAGEENITGMFMMCSALERVTLRNFNQTVTTNTNNLLNSTVVKKIRFSFPDTVTPQSLPVISTTALSGSSHFSGASPDGEIWVERADIAEALRQATNWSTYASLIHSDEEEAMS